MLKPIALAILILTTGVRTHAMDAPEADLFLGYSYIRANPAARTTPWFPNDGGLAALALNLNDWFAIESEFGCYYNGNVNKTGADSTSITYLVGPRLSFERSGGIYPYFHALFGVARVSSSTSTQAGVEASRHSFAMAVGGGLDFQIKRCCLFDRFKWTTC
jgi:hypothetical protein